MKIHTLLFNPDNWMVLTQELNQLGRFDVQWQAIERREKKTLKELKSTATVKSVGASARIEGSRLPDQEVEILIENPDILRETFFYTQLQGAGYRVTYPKTGDFIMCNLIF